MSSSQPSTAAQSVALPRRERVNVDGGNNPPIWAVSDAVGTEQPPLPVKCDRYGREGVCCKELKGDDERQLLDPDIVRDAIIGLSDGLTVPFALAAGLSSLGESKLVILGGVAELIAGAISMGIGGFLGSQAERDHVRYVQKHTAARVRRSCAGEMEREVHSVLGSVGVDEKLSRKVAMSLLDVEVSSGGHGTTNGSEDSLRRHASTSSDPEEGGLRWSKDVGITAFLIKFGEGLEEVPTRRLYISALTIGLGYLLGGIIPLLPYFFIPRAKVALIYSAIVTGITLLVFGAIKTHYTGAPGGVGGYIWGAVSTLLVGGTAAAAAYGIVAALEGGE